MCPWAPQPIIFEPFRPQLFRNRSRNNSQFTCGKYFEGLAACAADPRGCPRPNFHGLFWFPSSVLLPLRCPKITENLSTICPKSTKNHQKWRPGVVLGALGRAPGGIWVPRRPKAEKKLEKVSSSTPPKEPNGQPKLDQKVTWRHLLTYFE